MGLFYRREETTASVAPLYTTGQQKTYLIVGLGNPGKNFENTRHNLGFMVLDHFAKQNNLEDWVAKKDLSCQLSSGLVDGAKVLLCKPQTMMNLSGQAGQSVQHFYKLSNSQTVVVYDELALPLGTLRARTGGESAGHNGIKSMIEYMGEDFMRLRIGIGDPKNLKLPADSFVLGKFSDNESNSLGLILKEACSMLGEFVATGELPNDTRKIL